MFTHNLQVELFLKLKNTSGAIKMKCFRQLKTTALLSLGISDQLLNNQAINSSIRFHDWHLAMRTDLVQHVPSVTSSAVGSRMQPWDGALTDGASFLCMRRGKGACRPPLDLLNLAVLLLLSDEISVFLKLQIKQIIFNKKHKLIHHPSFFVFWDHPVWRSADRSGGVVLCLLWDLCFSPPGILSNVRWVRTVWGQTFKNFTVGVQTLEKLSSADLLSLLLITTGSSRLQLLSFCQMMLL